MADLQEDASATGKFVMPLADWNRYRFHTYKDNKEAEAPYLRTMGADDEGAVYRYTYERSYPKLGCAT